MNHRKDDFALEEQEVFAELGTSLESLQARHADCPRLEILRASQAGVLPEETARNIASHVDKCNLCRVLLRDLADEERTAARPEEERRVRARVFAGKDSKRTENVTASSVRVWFWRTVPLGAVVALVAMLWIRSHPAKSPAAGPSVVSEQASKPASPSIFQLEKLPIRLQASSVLVWRGKPRTEAERYTAELTHALDSYRNDNFAEAARQLAQVARRFPQGVEAQLYLGISQLYVQQDPDAILALGRAQNLGSQPFRDDATWYLALAYDRTGDRQHAVAELQRLCQGKGSYSERACAGIHELSAQPGAKPLR